MKKLTADQYKDGIASLNHFSEMLRDALETAIPEVKLRREAAFSWRGYQIEKCPGLKASQYYCQIELGNPGVLGFFEYYEMSHQPFRAEYDLAAHGFFVLTSYEAQKQMLVDFINQALTEARAWNVSKKRQEIVPERLW
jgi:hypothetical protein